MKCQHVEVVLDVLAFSFAALKHATAVVLQALASSVSALRTVVLQLLSEDASGDDDASGVLVVQPEREDRQKALRGDATRWLHVVFELYYQIRSFAAPRTLTALEVIAQKLYPLSAIFVAPASGNQAMDSGECTVPAAELLSRPPGMDNQQSWCGAAKGENAPAFLSSAEVLALCAAKWGRPKQPRSDLGKRAKGYFAGRSAAVPAAPAPAVPTADGAASGEPAGRDEREVASVGDGGDEGVDDNGDEDVDDGVHDDSGGAAPGTKEDCLEVKPPFVGRDGVFLGDEEEVESVHVVKMARTT